MDTGEHRVNKMDDLMVEVRLDNGAYYKVRENGSQREYSKAEVAVFAG